MVIALDAMGGDLAPQATVEGAIRCAPSLEGEVILVGPADRLEKLLAATSRRPSNIRVVDAPQVVDMDEKPKEAWRNKRDSSLQVSVNLVRDGVADACISAGNSGAFMLASQLQLRNLPGLQRPAIAVLMPGPDGDRILIDGGANMDCRPSHLAQFGMMGSIYAEHALKRDNPRVGLLSIGHEPRKGDSLTLAAHSLLEAAPINFIGNVEGDQLLGAGVDVVVADGFVGNVALKVTEGVAHFISSYLKEGIRASWVHRLGALLLKRVFHGLRSKMDYAAYGGALMLGVQGICVVCHGRSNALAIENALRVAQGAVQGQVREHLAEGIARLAEVVPAPTDMAPAAPVGK